MDYPWELCRYAISGWEIEGYLFLTVTRGMAEIHPTHQFGQLGPAVKEGWLDGT